jgi:hypothetical protein
MENPQINRPLAPSLSLSVTQCESKIRAAEQRDGALPEDASQKQRSLSSGRSLHYY